MRRNVSTSRCGQCSLDSAKAEAVLAESGQTALFTTFEKDSLGARRARTSRLYASISNDMVFMDIHTQIHACILSVKRADSGGASAGPTS